VKHLSCSTFNVNTSRAASILWQKWTDSTRIAQLPEECRPSDRADGYAIQRQIALLSRQPVVGWKIAATSRAGQAHIGVEGPLVGSLLANRVLSSGAMVSLGGNHMRVAEAEFAFLFARALPCRSVPYQEEEVMDAIESLHPAIEIPDSRYEDFARVGAPQLIADNACACWLIVGSATTASWRELDLALHEVQAFLNGSPAATGVGSNVLGSPRNALTWIANELRVFGNGLRAGDLVTTGTCIVPVPIAPGDDFRADLGDLGSVEMSSSD
jgi:2-keto-4-pentenoate hydratase